MGQIPQAKTGNLGLDLFLSRLKSQLDPIIESPILNGSFLLNNIQLSATSPTQIPHKLGRIQVGWMLADINGQARIWRSQPLNALTLTLSSDANVVVSLWVF